MSVSYSYTKFIESSDYTRNHWVWVIPIRKGNGNIQNLMAMGEYREYVFHAETPETY